MFKNRINFVRRMALCGGLAVAAGSASAAGLDFTTITSAVDVSTVATAIIAMGALMILPGVAKWGAKKLAGFFG